MALRPLHDMVLIERSATEEKTAGGLFIPNVAQKEAQEGKVIAVGPGKLRDDGERVPPQVKPGDLVAFQRYGSQQLNGDQQLLVVREQEILCIIEKDA